MRFRPLLVLGLLLGAEASQHLGRRQATASSDDDDETSVAAAPTSTSEAAEATTSAPGETTSEADVATTTDAPTSDSGDTTVTRTTTVAGDGDSVTSRTTTLVTKNSVIWVTSTVFETTTVTSRDADTATKTVYETTTSWANEKRALDLAPRTVGPEYFEVEARATDVPSITQINWEDLELVRPNLQRHANDQKHQLQKRATITQLVTVTADGDASTLVDTVTKTVISTVTSNTKVTSTVTETEQADAKTTVTTTSTLTVVSTRITTGVVVTVTEATGTLEPAGTSTAGSDSDSSSSSGSGSSSGLSTGAKAGIGVGAGLGGLALIGLIAWLLFRRRNRGPKPDPDDMFGASEVPVGGPVSGSNAPMSQHSTSAAGYLSPTRASSKPSTTAEGYRGTAMGDGRAGYAKPQTFGSAYAPVSPETQYSRPAYSPGHTPDDSLPEHPSPMDHSVELGNDGTAARWHQSNAAEMDSTPARPHTTSPPPQNVYEMPSQPYR